ncbi:MAG: hypothetical protein IJ766_09905 [Clostridia bacterium]|nr:hypothetical protein [Clostridia bacterium]
MKILFVIGGELRINSSANLCHLAYLRGFVAAGHTVTLLTAADDGATLDPALTIPRSVKTCAYGVSLYEKLSHIKKQVAQHENVPAAAVGSEPSANGGMTAKLKGGLRALYGVYGPDHAWHMHAKHFRSGESYDYMISVSCPFISHRTAYELLRRGNVRCGKWIQIWEDPWYGDLAGDFHTDAALREERFLCAAAQDVIYVSPVTLMYQQKLFPESAQKMRFVPTPSYDTAQHGAAGDPHTFGYFGDYAPSVRNLRPFYEAAKDAAIRAVICGSSSAPFESAENVEVHPRLSLSALAVYEKSAGTLVFLCNLSGGQIPGKIFQYSATNKPILFILDGTAEEQQAIRDYFSPLRRYVFCENNKEDIKKAIDVILSGQAPSHPLDCFSAAKTVDAILSE